MEVLELILVNLNPIDIISFKSTTYEIQYFIEEVEKIEGYWKKKLIKLLKFVPLAPGTNYRKVYENIHKMRIPYNPYALIELDYDEILEFMIQNLLKDPLSIIYSEMSDLIEYPLFGFIHACEHNSLKCVRMFLENPKLDPSENDNYALKTTIQNKRMKLLKLLLEDDRIKIDDEREDLLILGVKDDDLKLVKIALGAGKKKLEGADAFIYACQLNRIDALRLILKYTLANPGVNSNFALQESIKFGHLDIVKNLLKDKRVDPSAENYKLIKWFFSNKNKQKMGREEYEEIIKLLKLHPKLKTYMAKR